MNDKLTEAINQCFKEIRDIRLNCFEKELGNELSKTLDNTLNNMRAIVNGISSEKKLNITNTEELVEKVSDVEIFGNPDSFKLICKASSKSGKWMKSTKAMEIGGLGCVVQVTGQQDRNIAEALTFVPNCHIGVDDSGNRTLLKNS